MSFGFSVGDCLTVGNLAWNVYKACRDAPESFNNISVEVLSLHALLREVQETISGQSLSESTQQSLATITHGCELTLKDLQSLVERYQSLGSNTKRTFDRLKWGSKDIAELRARLTSNTVMLHTCLSTSQMVVEKKLKQLLQEFQEGKHEGSIMTTATIDSLAQEEKETWRAIRKEFEVIGISIAAFDANKAYIMTWFQKAIEAGAFDEQRIPQEPGSPMNVECFLENGNLYETAYSGSVQSQDSKLDHDSTSPHTAMTESSDLLQHLQSDAQAMQEISPVSGEDEESGNAALFLKTDYPPELMKEPESSTSRSRAPKVVTLLAWLLRYNRAFVQACHRDDLHKAHEYLLKGADINSSLNYCTALGGAASSHRIDTCVWLLDHGAGVDVRDLRGLSPLCRAMINMVPSIDLVTDSESRAMAVAALLIARGADVNASSGHEGQTAICHASRRGCGRMIQLLLRHNADPRIGRFSALHAAVGHGHVEAAGILLDDFTLWTGEELNKALQLSLKLNPRINQGVTTLLEHHVANLTTGCRVYYR